MYQYLKYYISNLTETYGINVSVYNHFTSVGVYSKYGCWGLMESSDENWQDSPKYRAYQDFIDERRTCSWTEEPPSCHNNCSSMGVCSSSNSLSLVKDTCYCYFGSNGTYCENILYIITLDCSYQCGGRGNCSYDRTEGHYQIHTCHCIPGYYGYGCTLFNCSHECNYNGHCIDKDVCNCYRGQYLLFVLNSSILNYNNFLNYL